MKKVKTNKMLLLKNIGKVLLAITLFSVIVYVPEKTFGASFEYKDFDWDKFQQNRNTFWDGSCETGDTECKNKVLESQKKFYKKFYKVLANYDAKTGKDGQRLHINDDIILQTIFFDMTHDVFKDDGTDYQEQVGSNTPGYSVDETSDGSQTANIDYATVDEHYFEQETDTIETLADNMIAYETICWGIVGPATETTDANGNKTKTCSDGHQVKDVYEVGTAWGTKCVDKLSDNELGFWEYFGSKLMHDNVLNRMVSKVFFLDKLIVDQAYEDCSHAEGYSGGTWYEFTDDRYVSTDRYFDFLKDNMYFDKKAHLQKYFKQDVLDPATKEYGQPVKCLTDDTCTESLESIPGAYDKYYGNIVADRLDIIEFIIDNLNNYGIEISYMDDYMSDLTEINKENTRKSFYWPIGSDQTEERDGRTYADKDPASTEVIREYGNNTNPRTGATEMHYGIDIKGVEGSTNVIAVYNGTVYSVVNNCTKGDYTCNNGYGNTVIISHPNGDYTVYGHLASVSSNITVGYDVIKGEVIGKVGATGDTNTAALHYELRKGGNSVENATNPTDVTSPDDPRPAIPSGDFSVHETSLTEDQFCSGLRTYCNNHDCGVFSVNCNQIYKTSISANVNPELVVARAMCEGFSPGGSTNNYWGIACTNTGGGKDCQTYSSLDAGIRGFASVVSKYNTASEMMSKYAYIGAYWYNPGSWSTGGCKYFSYIRQYMSTSRQSTVAGVCGSSAHCDTSGGQCTPTTSEDQNAYATWQVANKMGPIRYNIWGL